jgi:hypothetical protein
MRPKKAAATLAAENTDAYPIAVDITKDDADGPNGKFIHLGQELPW